jgi:hypothetical protein
MTLDQPIAVTNINQEFKVIDITFFTIGVFGVNFSLMCRIVKPL